MQNVIGVQAAVDEVSVRATTPDWFAVLFGSVDQKHSQCFRLQGDDIRWTFRVKIPSFPAKAEGQ